MSISEGFLLAIRWLHAVAAALWVGGSLFYLFALRPALRKGEAAAGPFNELVALEFRGLVDTSILVLVLTGAVLTFARLTAPSVGVSYVMVLLIKVLLALWMFLLARSRRRTGRLLLSPGNPTPAPNPKPLWLLRVVHALSGANLIAILGVIVFLLADLLKVLYERGLATR